MGMVRICGAIFFGGPLGAVVGTVLALLLNHRRDQNRRRDHLRPEMVPLPVACVFGAIVAQLSHLSFCLFCFLLSVPIVLCDLDLVPPPSQSLW